MLRKPILAALVALALTTAACKLASQPTSQPERSTTAPQSVQISGKDVYLSMGCVECHDHAAGVAAPTLQGLYGGMVSLESGETVLADEAYLRESILSPNAKIVNGYKPIMPDFKDRIIDEQVEALIEYIRSLAN